MSVSSEKNPKLEVGFHTGGFNSAYFSFPKTVEWARLHGVHSLECGFVDGVFWNHGLGYFPHLAVWEDLVVVKEMLNFADSRLLQMTFVTPESACIWMRVTSPGWS